MSTFIQDRYQALTREELHQFSGILSAYLRALMPLARFPAEANSLAAYRGLAEGLDTFRDSRIFSEFFPNWLDADALDEVLQECIKSFPTHPPSTGNNPLPWYADPGPKALALIKNSDFFPWIAEKFGRTCLQPPSLSYLKYTYDAQSSWVHIDTPSTHGINCLIGLGQSTLIEEGKSKLRIFELMHYTDFDLSRGKVVVFHAACTPHARTPLLPGEAVYLLSVGFPWDVSTDLSPIRAKVTVTSNLA